MFSLCSMASLGDRYPALWLNRDQSFHFTSGINNIKNFEKNYFMGHTDFDGQFYEVIIEQKLVNGKWMYQVIVDGQLFLSKENRNPMTLGEAKLYLSDPWYDAANIEFTYFKMEY